MIGMTDNPIKAYRVDHGLSLERLAAKFGVHKTTAMRWEARPVPPSRVLEIERETGISRHTLRPDLYPEAV